MGAIKYAPWSSDIELSFYAALRSLKINHDKLDDAARRILGKYEIRPADSPERSSRIQLLGDAFTNDQYDKVTHEKDVRPHADFVLPEHLLAHIELRVF